MPSEASQEVAPTLPARHPRLLVCRAKSRLRQANSATSARFGAGIRLVDLCQGFFFLELGCTSVPDIPRTEQSFSQFFFHNCVWWLIVRRMPSSAGETIHRAARQLQLRSLSRAPCEGKASPVAPGCCLEVEADRVCGLVGSPARHVPNVSRSPVRRTIAMPTIAAVSSSDAVACLLLAGAPTRAGIALRSNEAIRGRSSPQVRMAQSDLPERRPTYEEKKRDPRLLEEKERAAA